MKQPDCYDYVRRMYRVSAFIGARVKVDGREGVLVRVRCPDQYLHIRFDGETRHVLFGPSDCWADHYGRHVECRIT